MINNNNTWIISSLPVGNFTLKNIINAIEENWKTSKLKEEKNHLLAYSQC